MKSGIETGAANAILIKPNQIGTLSETMQVIQMAKDNGYESVRRITAAGAIAAAYLGLTQYGGGDKKEDAK